MQRRDFIATGATLAAGGLGCLARAETRRPNVLLILVDQMRSPVWTPLCRTPNIDRLAASGVSFNRHFVAASPCSPSRACLLTGTHTTRNGMYLNCDFTEGDAQPSLDPSIPTVGHLFEKAGYRTPYRGKWHLTLKHDRNKRDPLADYGFEGWKPPDAPFGGPPYSGAVQDPVYARQAARWLLDKDNRKQPWFLVCSLVNPHDICSWPRYYPQRRLRPIRTEEPPANWADDLSGKPGCQKEYQDKYNKIAGKLDPADPDEWRRYLDYYIHCIEDADCNVGMVLEALEKSGQKDNTLVVFTSDHGDMGGSHRLRAKGCFAYEEEMRTPLIFSMPGLKAGVTSDAMASSVDVMPTLLSLAGIENSADGLPGMDLSSVVKAPLSSGPRDHVIFHQDSEIKTPGGVLGGGPKGFVHPAHLRCLRDADWKYALYFKPGSDQSEEELYNLKDDPLELDNLANDAGYSIRNRSMRDALEEEESRLNKN